ncbi:MAG: hypothetical protein GX579_11625 [Chloroflexi bacterium]|jgi:hypothetical protein|nr:hypothetical protein [Chloroflexota bacterium]
MPNAVAKYRIFFLIAVFVLLPATAFAAVAALDTWVATHNNIDKFRVDLYAIDESNLPAVTYKYAVTDLYNGQGDDPALSHWALGIGLCARKVANPTPGPYTTPMDPAVCGTEYDNCVSTTYTVEHVADPTTGVDGIKFEDADEQLGFGETHLFHITVAGETGRGEIDVAIKAGGLTPAGTILGPLCQPSAVAMTGASVAGAGNATFAAVAAAVMFMGVLSVGVLRKK